VPAAARFGLIGCGAIGSLLDEGRSGESVTHAAAITRAADAELVAVADTDAERASACAQARGVRRWYVDAREMLEREALDAVVIATPPAGRVDIVDAALAAGVRLVWLEKPAAVSVAEAQLIADRCAAAGVVVAVNHLRRWAPLLDSLREVLAAGLLGVPQLLVGTYTKGLRNNGLHLLDLVAATVGRPQPGRLVRRLDDGRTDDPTYDVLMDVRAEDGAVVPLRLLGVDHRHFQLFELDLIGSTGRVLVTDGGRALSIETVEDDPLFPGYRHLAPASRRQDLLTGMFDRAVAQLVAVLHGAEAAPRCTLADAMVSMAAVEAMTEAGA
jgi:predicted dehydrogenase